MLLFTACITCYTACNSPEAPIDAETRQRIDSTATAQVRLARVQIDSQFRLYHDTHLPALMDSVRKVRLREIEEKLRNIPH